MKVRVYIRITTLQVFLDQELVLLSIAASQHSTRRRLVPISQRPMRDRDRITGAAAMRPSGIGTGMAQSEMSSVKRQIRVRWMASIR